MLRVIIESPFGTNPDGSRCSPEEYERNRVYVLRCLRDSLDRDEAPFASHALYPLVLDNTDEWGRDHGMVAGWAWARGAALCAVYVDYGTTEGMAAGVDRFQDRRRADWQIETRSIGKNP